MGRAKATIGRRPGAAVRARAAGRDALLPGRLAAQRNRRGAEALRIARVARAQRRPVPARRVAAGRAEIFRMKVSRRNLSWKRGRITYIAAWCRIIMCAWLRKRRAWRSQATPQ